ncbi:hypothetical protein C9374_005069 [Naegleria lovaniensis]|uniref:Kinesin motor domain-containing protein n=1 Tax=Naegleria lovaniensis TaxID=51637 RepID=A0AA88KI61_NAELO|nr:uncharacterized protein C9374_005069 [Naegleria lovaniensis]KAG2382489.1 hypothetical protein C9374_005069 [Naegleria lovaniensis]
MKYSNDPNYYYEASDLEHLTIYEHNVRAHGKTFGCDHIYNVETSQFEIFDKEVVPLVEKLFLGEDSALLLFGDEGRRFTLEGFPDSPGIFFRTIELILDAISNDNTFKGSKLFISSCTIENENIYDNSTNNTVTLKHDTKKCPQIVQCSETEIDDVKTALQLYYEWMSKFVKVGNTSYNHLIIRLRLNVGNISSNNDNGVLNILIVGNTNLKPEKPEISYWMTHLIECLELMKRKHHAIPFHKCKLSSYLKGFLQDTSQSVSIFNLLPLTESYFSVINWLTICDKFKNCLLAKASMTLNSKTERPIQPPENPLIAKDQEIEELKRSNQILTEKVRKIEKQLRLLHEKQQMQAHQIDDISPKIEKNITKDFVRERYREVMEGSILKLKSQVHDLETKNLLLKKEMAKKEMEYQRRIADLVNVVKITNPPAIKTKQKV